VKAAAESVAVKAAAESVAVKAAADSVAVKAAAESVAVKAAAESVAVKAAAESVAGTAAQGCICVPGAVEVWLHSILLLPHFPVQVDEPTEITWFIHIIVFLV
jgi:uncharacterized membrane protein YqiK